MGIPMLAIIVPDLFRESVTFFHEHIAHIAPGRTIVVHLSTTGEEAPTEVPTLEVPLSSPWPEPRWPLLNRVVRQINVHRAATLSHASERLIEDFLLSHGATHLFAEFASTGSTILPVAKNLALPLTVMSHGWDVNVLGSMPQWRWRYRKLFQEAKLIANSPFLYGRMVSIGAPRERLRIVSCAVATPPISPVSHEGNRTRVVMLSRMTPQKGPLHSLRAFALAADQHDALSLDIVGDGPMLAQIRDAVRELRLEERTTIHGMLPHDQAKQIVSESHLLIQHCLTLPGGGIESQGLSVMEAMSCGLVPIVTRHGAFPDYIRDGKTGWLVDEGDINAMAKRLVRMAADPAARRRIGVAARDVITREFSRDFIYPRLRAAIGLAT